VNGEENSLAIDFEETAAQVERLKQLDFTDFRFEKGDLSIAVRRFLKTGQAGTQVPARP